jgi:hypothetical protein
VSAPLCKPRLIHLVTVLSLAQEAKIPMHYRLPGIEPVAALHEFANMAKVEIVVVVELFDEWLDAFPILGFILFG